MTFQITRSVGAAAVVLMAFGVGPAWAQGFRAGGAARMPVRGPVLTSQGFAAFNRFGSGAFTQPGTFATNNSFATPAGSFAISSRNAFQPATGMYTTRVREVAQSNFGAAMLTTRDAFNPYTGAFVARTRESFVPNGFNTGFGSPWASSFSAFQNPYAANPYAAMYANPYGNWMANPNFNTGAGNPWAYAGLGVNPFVNPYAPPNFGYAP